jgi:hypothetical protein
MLILSRAQQDFDAAMSAAVRVHHLEPGQFKWLSGSVQYPMEPQPILAPIWPLEALVHDNFRSSVTVYGGSIANQEGDFSFGHVHGFIAEATPPGVKHQSTRVDPPVPYITRVLTIKNGVVTVRTPEKDLPTNQGPVVFEGMNGFGRYATITCYNPLSGTLTVRSGDFITDGHGWSIDRTVEEDALQLHSAITQERIATMTRTLTAAADILRKMAQWNSALARWEVTPELVPSPAFG